MKRVKLWACVIVSVAVATASFAEPPKTAPKSKPKAKAKAKSATSKPATGSAEKPVRNRAVQAMKIMVENAEFDEMPFEDFVEWLERVTEANVVVRWKVLESAGIEKDRPLTLKQKNIPLGKLLPMAFDNLTRDIEGVEIAAKASGNILLITTRADLNSKMLTRSYDIESLRIVVPDFKGRQANLDGVGQGPAGRPRGGALAGGGGSTQGGASADAETQRLIAVITSMIDPPSWKVNGGKGTITEFKGNLIIRNGEEVHDALEAMLGGPAGKSNTP